MALLGKICPLCGFENSWVDRLKNICRKCEGPLRNSSGVFACRNDPKASKAMELAIRDGRTRLKPEAYEKIQKSLGRVAVTHDGKLAPRVDPAKYVIPPEVATEDGWRWHVDQEDRTLNMKKCPACGTWNKKESWKCNKCQREFFT